MARANCPHTERLLGEVIGRHTELRVLDVVPGKYTQFRFGLESYCALTELRELNLPDMNIRSVPACFSGMRELRNVNLACNYLTEPPYALAGLPQLRSFIAFRQGEWTPCHLEPGGRPAALRDASGCKPVWESKTGQDGDDNPRVLCPSLSLHGSLGDFAGLGWPRLEKLWLDGNFLAGEIPERLPEVWPQLTSLDVYSNNLTGSIPASLAELQLHKLQLQDNQLSGKVPAGLFAQPICALNLAANAGLTGCFRAGALPPHVRGIAGTGIVSCPVAAAAGGEL